MGLLDRFRKNKEQENVRVEQNELPFNVEFAVTPDGRLQVDFYDKKADFKQFYDTTRLIANPQPINSYGDKNVLNCNVSWYGINDAEMLDPRTGQEIGRRADYRGVLAQIDLNLLQTDANYCYTVMKGLLDKKRVEKYLDRGLEETPDLPCGKYIGGIEQKENQYKKVFDPSVGRMSHYSNLMVRRRQDFRESQEIKRQRQIDSRRKEIERLEGEIEDLEK